MAEFVIRGAGSVLRKHRLALDLTLAELAERFGGDKSQLAKYENNNIGITDAKLMRLAKALGLSPETLAHEWLARDQTPIAVEANRPTARTALRTNEADPAEVNRDSLFINLAGLTLAAHRGRDNRLRNPLWIC